MTVRRVVKGLHRLIGATVVVGLAIAAAGSGCDRGRAKRRSGPPDVLVITVCTFRQDHMSFAGYPADTTPFLDAMARRGVFFDNAMSASSWTKPAVASILSGLTPRAHGLTDYYEIDRLRSAGFEPKRVLSDSIVTIAEVAQSAGYRTGYQGNNIHAGPFFNMTQGFDDVEFHRIGADTSSLLERFSNWLEDLDSERPFFFFLLTRDPHLQYDPREEAFRHVGGRRDPAHGTFQEFSSSLQDRVLVTANDDVASVSQEDRQRFAQLYDAELYELDRALARIPEILEDAGRADDTIVVVTADHGERLFDGLAHKKLGHAARPDQRVLHIPLLAWGPGLPRGRRVTELVRTIDLLPTVASLMGASIPDSVQGESLLPLIRGEETSPRHAFSATERWTALREADHVLYRKAGDGRGELFELAADPQEANNILSDRPEVAARLGRETERWLDESTRIAEEIGVSPVRELTPDVIEQLRALGYVE